MKILVQIIREKQQLCQCGRKRHYKDAIYCADCGKKLEEAVAAASRKNHL